MRQLPIPDESWSEAEAMRLLRGRRPQPAGRLNAALTRTVQDAVIPRLLAAHRPTSQEPAQTSLPSPGQIATLADLSLAASQDAASTYVLALRRDGMATETLLLDLITPAARRLGVGWEEDTCSFSDVTLGALRLGHAVRALEPPAAAPAPGAPAALLAPVPGESHGLGIAILGQLFRRAGWRTREAGATTLADLCDILRHSHFDIAGLSLACDDRLATLAEDITALRRASSNRAIHLLVGGAPFVLQPQLADSVGADATATDAAHAVRQAQRLLAAAACA